MERNEAIRKELERRGHSNPSMGLQEFAAASVNTNNGSNANLSSQIVQAAKQVYQLWSNIYLNGYAVNATNQNAARQFQTAINRADLMGLNEWGHELYDLDHMANGQQILESPQNMHIWNNFVNLMEEADVWQD